MGELGVARAIKAWMSVPFGLQAPGLPGDPKNVFIEADGEAGPGSKLRASVLLTKPYAAKLEQAHRTAWEAEPRKGDAAALQWQPLALDGDTPRINVSVLLGPTVRQARTLLRVALRDAEGQWKIENGRGWAFLKPLWQQKSQFQGSLVKLVFKMERYSFNGKVGISFKALQQEIGAQTTPAEPEYVPCEADDAEMLAELDAEMLARCQ